MAFPWLDWLKEKREKTHINKIRNEREATTDITNIHRIRILWKAIRHQINNLEEMGKFLEIYNLPRPNHEETENLNRLMNSEEIDTTIKNLSKK